jgi:hypothetical protein
MKFYMFRASTVPVIRSYQLYTWHLVSFMQLINIIGYVAAAANQQIHTCSDYHTVVPSSAFIAFFYSYCDKVYVIYDVEQRKEIF